MKPGRNASGEWANTKRRLGNTGDNCALDRMLTETLRCLKHALLVSAYRTGNASGVFIDWDNGTYQSIILACQKRN
eukprot:11463836-Heterocapsa_arctica.AAC.1